MSSSDNMRVTLKNNRSLLRKESYFEKRKRLRKNKRTGESTKPFKVNKDAYRLSQERKALMFKKGTLLVTVLLISFAAFAYLIIQVFK